MNKILPVIISVIVTAVASSSITYFVTVDKVTEKYTAIVEESKKGNENEGELEDVEILPVFAGQEQIVTGSSTKNSVEIKSAEYVKTNDGKDAVIITLAYSNHSGDADSFFDQFSQDFVYQNGVELKEVYSDSFGDEFVWGDKYAKVKVDCSNEFKSAFLLNDLESEILIECVERNSDNNYVVSRVFNID